jgi:hypothetical protein
VLRLMSQDPGAPPAGESQREPARSSATIGRGRRAGGYVLAAAAGLVAGVWLGSAFVPPAPEPSTAMYKRSTAFMRACQAAGAEIARLRRTTVFIDDCTVPIVTPIFGEEGQVIVRRIVEGYAGDDDAGRVTYSVKMDGRGVDGWRMLEVRRAPSHLTLDASLLPTTRGKVPTSAQR